MLGGCQRRYSFIITLHGLIAETRITSGLEIIGLLPVFQISLDWANVFNGLGRWCLTQDPLRRRRRSRSLSETRQIDLNHILSLLFDYGLFSLHLKIFKGDELIMI